MYYSAIKQKGYKVTDVLIWLCTIQTMNMNIYQATCQELSNMILCEDKYIYYRLMENHQIHLAFVTSQFYNNLSDRRQNVRNIWIIFSHFQIFEN